jgi:hypothetical protein
MLEQQPHHRMLAADEVVDGRHRHATRLGQLAHRQPLEPPPPHDPPRLLEDPLPPLRLVVLEQVHAIL